MSPISKVDDVHTPTLIVHGGSDLRCPVGQAQQWHTALRQRGVPTRLVLYPGGSHLFVIDGPPSHRMDFNHRVVDWVEQYAGDLAGPRRPRLDAAHWERRLQTLAAKHGVPGATLGILRVQPGREDDEVHAAHGVLNQDTGVSTTTDSVFQIGSISKVWTATVAMQLVEEGLLHLDEPVIADFPELRLGDADVAQAVTLRHLLTHTSGIDGDVFTDTGRGDDCLAAYADGLENVGQIHPLGATWSYCNSGYTLIGRLIEKATGLTWDRAVRDRLFTPLGLGHTMTLPEDALLHRTAVGHVSDGQGGLAVAPVWMLPRSMGPSGLICSTVEDVLSFARMHLLAGVGPNADRLLSEDAATAMTALQAEVPDKHTLGDSWGLGWIRFGWNGSRLVGHDGNTIGQAAFLRLLPEHGLAVTLLTNGGNATDLYQDLYREIFAALADVAMPLPLAPPAQPPTVDLARHAGTYEREGFVMDVVPGDQPVLRITVAGPLAELTPDASHVYALTAVDETGDLYAVRDEGAETWVPVTFFALTTGEPYLHFGARATPKAT
jgi:CubicO group peptidase (beta-lactamase class C family)